MRINISFSFSCFLFIYLFFLDFGWELNTSSIYQLNPSLMFFIPFSSLSKIDQMSWSYVIINTNLVLRNTKFACLNTAEYEISLQIYQIYIVLIVWHQWGSTHLMHQFHVNLFIALELKLFLFCPFLMEFSMWNIHLKWQLNMLLFIRWLSGKHLW